MKNIFKNKRNILIMMFALVVIMGIGFAAYSQQLTIKDTSSIDSNWDVYIKSVDVKNTKGGATGNGTVDSKTAASLTTDLKYPGDNVIYNITVANDGTIDALLEKISFNMGKENTVIKYYYSVDDEATWNEVTKDSENPYDVDLLANTTDEFQVKVEYDPTKTGTATEEQKSNKLTLNLDYVQKTDGGTVIPSNSVLAGGQPVTLAEEGTDGLYEDEYEEGRYIYKGTDPDNYITFNGEQWRVMSIESDGTLKIIRNESIGNRKWDAEGTRNSSTSTYCTGASHLGCNAWASTTNLIGTPSDFTLHYPNGNLSSDKTTFSGTVTGDSSLNKYLNSTYLGTINDDSEYIVSRDFNIGTPGNYFDTEDFETDVAQEALYKWNGKVGLMSITDVLRATTKTTCTSLSVGYNNESVSVCSNNNWMWAKTGYEWTISPLVNASRNNVWLVRSDGYVSSDGAFFQNSGVRPAVYLTSDVNLNGTGTSDNPYTIS